MNPLIDVALVLLIFFILTATYATLRRTLDVPPPLPDEAGAHVPQPPPEDRAFTVRVTLDEQERPVVQVEQRIVLYERLADELRQVVEGTGRKEMYLKMSPDVTWETQVQVHSAATAAGVRQVHIDERRAK